MRFLTLPQIVIAENRQRQEFDPEALQDLKNSIQDCGLMHAIVVRDQDGKQILVAGERRLRAISEIYQLGGVISYNGALVPSGAFPCVSLGELSILEAEEAELDENLKRRDLTWQEHAAAVKRLHELRAAQKDAEFEAAARAGTIHGDASAVADQFPQHTVADTAREVYPQSANLPAGAMGDYQATVRKEIIVAQHLDNPVIAKAKNVDEAFKLLKKDEERKKNIELATQIGATFTVDSHRLLNVNCLQYMREVANGSAMSKFDVIATDPPYGMGADNFGDGGGKLSGIEHHYDDSYESWKKLMQEWCPLSFAVTKPQAHAYVFCDIDNFHELKSMMQGAGWYVFRTPLICVKPNSGRVPLPEHGPRRQYEVVLYAFKGDKPVTHIYPDVISCAADENLSHGAQKPVAVFQNLLQRSVRPGDRVFDGFAGTGPIFPAAHGFKCVAVGCELTPEYYALSLKRLQAMKEMETPDFFSGV